MFRALTFFFFLIVSVFGQTQQVGSKELHLSFTTENLKDPSVANQIPSFNAPTPPSKYSFNFFGTSDPSAALIVNDRWNMVGTYSLLFFSFVLNVFLVLKLWNYRQSRSRAIQSS